MPTLPAVSKVVRIDFHMSQAGNTNIMIREFFRYGGTLSFSDAGTWLAAINTAWAGAMSTFIHNSVTMTLSELTDLTSLTSPQVQNASGGTGGNSNAPLNAGTAMVIRHRIVRRYRGGHPRVYLPGITRNVLSTPTQYDSTLAGAILGVYQTFINSCVSGVPAAASPATHVNVSYFQGFTVESRPPYRPIIVPTPRGTPVVDAIIDYTVNLKPTSQRRRNTQ